MLVVGIDEAGYGPTLGPLVVAASLWRIRTDRVKDDLWRHLDACVRRPPNHDDAHLTVGDSKAVFHRKKGISTLERPVLAFASAAGLPCETLTQFLHALDPDFVDAHAIPWYRELSRTLPIERSLSRFAAVAGRLRGVMDAAEVRCCGLTARVVTEDRFNARVASTRNKAAVLIEQILRLIVRAAEHAGDGDLLVRVDRLGGRANYRALLHDAFPDRHLHEVEVSETVSRYRLADARSDWFVEFSVQADSRHLPVALASMTAKYVREALMGCFNEYWRTWLPDLKPTAGYYTDARRFLSEIEPVLERSRVPRDAFVRSR